MPECDGLFDMFENPINNSDELNQLLAMLRTSTFKGRSMLPSFLSHTGRIFAANRLMDVSKHEWVSVFKAIGQLDVYLSIAKLIKESEGKRVQYSFVNFIESDRPVLLLQDFWNPLINENDVVPNTITLGKSYGPRSMIITGPNSGGKSVVLKSVALSVLLAQTLGITPATKAMITPFSTINSLINVTDAIPSGLSRFRAEVAQAKGLSAKLKRQRSNEFNLVVSDELFSSTSEDQAEELIYEYAKAFATPNNICLQATHHPKYMVQLEQEVKDGSINVFGNYKVDIDQLPEGKLKRNYKLERGVSSQKFAKKILEEVGALPA
jgi:DNA mismatch repair ATPase MutS